MNRVELAGQIIDDEVHKRLSHDTRDPDWAYYRRYRRVLGEVVRETESGQLQARHEFQNRVTAYAKHYDINKDTAALAVADHDPALSFNAFGSIMAHQELRSRANTTEDILRIVAGDVDFAKECAASFLDDEAQKTQHRIQAGSSDPEQARGERYREALRQSLQKYPNVARAWSFGVWTEATVAEIWPHIAKQSPHRYV